MRRIFILTIMLLLMSCVGTAWAETTTMHVTVYNDTDEPFQCQMEGFDGTIAPGDNVYIHRPQVATYLKETEHAFKVSFIYAYGHGGAAVLVTTNEVNVLGEAVVKDFSTHYEFDVPFWEPDFSTKHDDDQVNWYLHIRNK